LGVEERYNQSEQNAGIGIGLPDCDRVLPMGGHVRETGMGTSSSTISALIIGYSSGSHSTTNA
jgi:hypothetical protein